MADMWELDDDTSDVLTDILPMIKGLSPESISALILELESEQMARRRLDRDINQMLEDRQHDAFNKRGLCSIPWIEEGVLWCPGEIIASSKSAHICQFASLGKEEGWVYDSSLVLGEKRWYLDKGGQRSITALEYHDGLEVVVVECKASMGNHTMQKARTYKVVGDELEYVGQREASPSLRRRPPLTRSVHRPGGCARSVAMRQETATGTYRYSGRGFGFIQLDDEDDLFVPPGNARSLLSGDVVTATFSMTQRGRQADRIVDISRENEAISGRVLSASASTSQVTLNPQRTRTIVQIEGSHPVGTLVLGQLPVQGEFEVTLISPKIDEQAVREFALSETGFPNTAPELPETFKYEDLARDRVDLRALATFTIDGEESKDLDDAISPVIENGKRILYVHIADVADQVRPGTALDDMAKTWCTSVYLPGWNRPMLPRALSEDVLSLLPGQDRDAMTVRIEFGRNGSIENVDIFESLIQSDRRFSYPEVVDLLTDEVSRSYVSAPVMAGLLLGAELHDDLAAGRESRGGLPTGMVNGSDYDSYEEPARNLIEQLMVATNEAVAQWCVAAKLAVPYRNHAAPGPKSWAEMEDALAHYGHHVTVNLSEPGSLQTLLGEIGEPRGELNLNTLFRAHLRRATYDCDPAGHFGLSSSGYLHFTSPIRRYADVLVHRAIKAKLRGEPSGSSAEELEGLLVRVNDRTGAAATAERMARVSGALADEPYEIGDIVSGTVTKVLRKVLIVTQDHGLGLQMEVDREKFDAPLCTHLTGMVADTDWYTGTLEFAPHKRQPVRRQCS